jgi:pyruvate dehydrogenase E1 component beta subunit
VVDPSWKSFGASSEIISFVCEKLDGALKACPQKITYPDSHTPATSHLEKNFYFESSKIISAINKQFKKIK